MPIRPSALFHLLLAISSGLTIPACSFRTSLMNEQEQSAKLDQFITDGGYSAPRKFQFDTLNETWWHDGKAIQISLLAPTEPGAYPLIVYLPSLGESANGGRLWREYWAKAGYLVLSIQPDAEAKAFAELKAMMPDNIHAEGPPGLADDQEKEELSDDPRDGPDGKLKPSKLARSGELRYIGREFFGPKALERRINHILWAYGQFQQRIKSKQGLFAKADSSQLLIAGYDIGAQTATALIGENIGFNLPAMTDFKPRAAVIISPSVDAAAGKLQERYQKITLPLLAITAEEDDDPYAITAPKLRVALWDYAASADNYLLRLKDADHRLLSGSSWSHHPKLQGPQPGDSPMRDFANSSRGGGRNGGIPAGGMGLMSSEPHLGARDTAPVPQQIAAIASVSNAFFDSIAKADKFAALWLTQKAQAWLKSVARLTHQ